MTWYLLPCVTKRVLRFIQFLRLVMVELHPEIRTMKISRFPIVMTSSFVVYGLLQQHDFPSSGCSWWWELFFLSSLLLDKNIPFNNHLDLWLDLMRKMNEEIEMKTWIDNVLTIFWNLLHEPYTSRRSFPLKGSSKIMM